jgi:glycerol-3-phosphate dehydrogenase (NAD(P)+)
MAKRKAPGAFQRIGVAGAGAWGIALANVCARAGRDVVLWGRDGDAIGRLAATRMSVRLPGVRLDRKIAVEAEVPALAGCGAVLLVAPAQATRDLARKLEAELPDSVALVACAKGIERGADRFMTEVLREAAPRHGAAILSGPSFAADVAAGLPTAVALASEDEALAEALARALASPAFRVYHSSDARGVEIGGAAKNVLAIACGIAAGLALGASANAALIARGFAELSRFGEAYGAQPRTLAGLSGLGDLVLTCTSPQSRNFALGLSLGQGRAVAEALAAGGLAEGAYTARALIEMARAKGVEMPIAAGVDAVLSGALGVRAAVEALLARPTRTEG